MDSFFMQDSSVRRKFIDKLIFLLYPNHAKLLNQQEKLLKERLNVLLNYQSNAVWLNSIEEQLVSISVAIVAQRLLFIKQLNPLLQTKTKYALTLDFSGEIEDLFKQHSASLIVEKALLQKTLQARKNDTKAKQNSYSANKSKLIAQSLHHNNVLCSQCSVGEQKTMVINIINAFIQLLINYKKYPPAILLDEINVHLDKQNIDYIIQDMLKYNIQLFITATSNSYYTNFADTFNILNLG